MHVLGVTFVLEGELSYLSIFVVEGTRSIAIKLSLSLLSLSVKTCVVLSCCLASVHLFAEK